MFNGGAFPSLADIAAVTGNGNNNSGNGNGWGDGNGWWVLIILFALFGWGGNRWGGGDNSGSNNGNGGSCSTMYIPYPMGLGSSGSYMGFSEAAVQRGFDNQGIMNKLNGLENGICSLGYDQLAQMNNLGNTVTQTGWQIQNAIQQDTIAGMQRAFGLQSQIADCCCENRAAIAQVRYDAATNTCAITNAVSNAARDIIDNANANYRALHEENVQAQLAAKDSKIAEQASLIAALNNSVSQANQTRELINTLRPCPEPCYITCNPWGCNGYGGAGYGYQNAFYQQVPQTCGSNSRACCN